ncbi:lipopolysaccharide biosynthesis protein [Mesorhizobium sp. BR1-1-16]|uniref:lipopolysaccharide biosynthesis protein n=1 Tax=Mesorhizobium sp. BR1-1-16 TaxID=2876653 RepID=UPI001CCEE70A|nr:lipopolysaccharide biosynthesis protein [Mesorhizobium sp. BR1-1-16]MBZ9937877.1 lipopolysaccharide biosynthesis protein [Mesorhizobium sp. BR1-1-16]
MSLIASLRRPATSTSERMFRGMMMLAFGGILARAIGVITVPILARIYTPADYGMLSVYTSIVQMILPVLTLRYVVAIPLPRRDAMAFNVFVLSTLLMLGFSIVVGIGLALFGPDLLRLASAEKLASWWWLILVGVLTAGFAEIIGSWATRHREYKLMARNSVTVTVLGESIKIIFGLLGWRPFGLLVGQMAVQSGGAMSFTRHFWPQFKANFRKVSRKRLAFVARYYSSYPLFRLPSQFLLVYSMQAPLLFTAGLYGVDISGQLGLALMTLALPINLIGQAMGKAYYAEVAKIGRKNPAEIMRLTKHSQLRLLLGGLVPTLVLMFLGPQLFAFAFGEKWRVAGEFAATLSSYTLLQFTSAPLIQLLNIFNRQSVFLILNIIRTIAVSLLFHFCVSLKLTAPEYVFAYSMIMTVFYVGVTGYIFWLTINASRTPVATRSP